MKQRLYEGVDPSTNEKFIGTLDYKFFDAFYECIVIGLVNHDGEKKEFSSSNVKYISE